MQPSSALKVEKGVCFGTGRSSRKYTECSGSGRKLPKFFGRFQDLFVARISRPMDGPACPRRAHYNAGLGRVLACRVWLLLIRKSEG
jgi:hypothetical protein